MAWLLLFGALVCFVLAISLNMGTGMVLFLLLAALVLLVAGTSALLQARLSASVRPETQMIDPAEMRRLREQAEARRQAPPES